MIAKRIILLLIFTFILAFSAVGFCFADSLNFAALPISDTSSYSNFVSTSFDAGIGVLGSNVYLGSLFDNAYIGVVGYRLYLVTTSTSSAGRYTLSSKANSGSWLSTFSQSQTVNSSSGNTYYCSYPNINLFDSQYPSSILKSFDTLQELVDAVDSGDDGSTVGERLNFTLAPGYSLVIEGPCEISDRLFTISNSWNFEPYDLARVNGVYQRTLAVQYIRDGYSADRGLTLGQLLPWWADNTNVLGAASDYSYHATDVIALSSGNTYVLGYPLYYKQSGDFGTLKENAVNLTGSLYLQYTGERPSIRLVAIESLSEAVNGQLRYYTVFRPEIYDESGEASADDGNVVITFPTAPSGGGNSGQPPADEETNLFGVLSKFISDIKNLIKQGSQAISELVEYGGQFMRQVSQMYDWLPSTLSSLILSAFVIVLVIGVIKTLWK